MGFSFVNSILYPLLMTPWFGQLQLIVMYMKEIILRTLVTLHARRVALCSKLFESITSCPDHKLVPVLPPKREHRHNLRQSRAYAMPRTHTNRFKNTFIPSMCT